MSLRSTRSLMPEKQGGPRWQSPAADRAARPERIASPVSREPTRRRTRLADVIRSAVRWGGLALLLTVALVPVVFALVPAVTIAVALFLPALLPVLAFVAALLAGNGPPAEGTDRHAGGPAPVRVNAAP